jgi:hypothetical protein
LRQQLRVARRLVFVAVDEDRWARTRGPFITCDFRRYLAAVLDRLMAAYPRDTVWCVDPTVAGALIGLGGAAVVGLGTQHLAGRREEQRVHQQFLQARRLKDDDEDRDALEDALAAASEGERAVAEVRRALAHAHAVSLTAAEIADIAIMSVRLTEARKVLDGARVEFTKAAPDGATVAAALALPSSPTAQYYGLPVKDLDARGVVMRVASSDLQAATLDLIASTRRIGLVRSRLVIRFGLHHKMTLAFTKVWAAVVWGLRVEPQVTMEEPLVRVQEAVLDFAQRAHEWASRPVA